MLCYDDSPPGVGAKDAPMAVMRCKNAALLLSISALS